jgi:hypothetical protein
MTIQHFVNNKRGLSTDTKPSATNLFPVLFLETDTGRIITSTDGTTLTTIHGFDKVETKQNKMINVEKNTLINTSSIIDTPFNPQGNIKGGHLPAGTISSSFYGELDSGDMLLYNPLDPTIQPGIGLVSQFYSTTANELMGFRSFTPQFNRAIQETWKFEVGGDSSRVLVGFSTSSLFDPSFGLANTDKGVVMGFTKFEGYYSVFNNDGTGSRIITNFPTLKDQQNHVFEIDLTPTNIICKLDNIYQVTLTTRIPSTTDPLYLIVYGIV